MNAARAVLHLHADPLVAARSFFEEVASFALSAEGQSMDHSSLEHALNERGGELIRKLMQAAIDHKAPGKTDEPVVDADGRPHTREREQTRTLETIFGTVVIRRTGYSADGAESLRPLDAQLNLPEDGYSFGVRRRAAEEAAKTSFDEAVQTLAEHTAARVPKRQLEELVQKAAQDFDAFYADRQAAVPGEPRAEASDEIVVITADGKGVVMHNDDLREVTRAAATADDAPPSLARRVTGAEKKHRKRMATVAAVYTVRPHVRTPEQVFCEIARDPCEPQAIKPLPRPRPQSKRVWASLQHEPADVVAEAFREASSRDVARTQKWVAVVDGNEHQLDLIELGAKRQAVELTVVLDVFHVLGYVWHATRALEGGDEKRTQAHALDRMRSILRGKAVDVAAGLRRSATRRGLTPAERKPVDEGADYLLKYREYLKYHEYLAAGFPIASGVIEGACRHLVKDRMAITGARWRLRGAEAVLRIRALRSSGDFDEYWKFHEASELQRNHAAKYFERHVPALSSADAPRPSA